MLAYAPRRPLETTTRSLSETRTEQSSLRGSHFGVYEYHFNCDFRATRRNSIYGFIHKICQNLTAASSCQALSVACHVTRRSIWDEVPALLWYFHCTIFDDRCSFVALAIPSWRFMPATLPNALALPDPCVHTPLSSVSSDCVFSLGLRSGSPSWCSAEPSARCSSHAGFVPRLDARGRRARSRSAVT